MTKAQQWEMPKTRDNNTEISSQQDEPNNISSSDGSDIVAARITQTRREKFPFIVHVLYTLHWLVETYGPYHHVPTNGKLKVLREASKLLKRFIICSLERGEEMHITKRSPQGNSLWCILEMSIASDWQITKNVAY
uniref:Uncharacterized protein n=1 Tax=Glossina pallidipes TaxID=7398 RepID=A0A1A9ZK08_GLOPL